MNNNPIKIVHIYITGKVQGVSYRWWFQSEGEKNKEHVVRTEYPNGNKQFYEGIKDKEHVVPDSLLLFKTVVPP